MARILHTGTCDGGEACESWRERAKVLADEATTEDSGRKIGGPSVKRGVLRHHPIPRRSRRRIPSTSSSALAGETIDIHRIQQHDPKTRLVDGDSAPKRKEADKFDFDSWPTEVKFDSWKTYFRRESHFWINSSRR